jgi:hypothetical protein
MVMMVLPGWLPDPVACNLVMQLTQTMVLLAGTSSMWMDTQREASERGMISYMGLRGVELGRRVTVRDMCGKEGLMHPGGGEQHMFLRGRLVGEGWNQGAAPLETPGEMLLCLPFPVSSPASSSMPPALQTGPLITS